MLRSLFVIVFVVASAGCSKKGITRQDPARPVVVAPAPAVIAVPVRTYLQIEPRLTQRCTWVKNGTLEQVLEVSRGRKRCLEFYETNLSEIEQVQGTPATEGTP